MIDRLLAILADARAQGEAVQPPATPEALARARAELRDRLGATLPDAVARLLGVTNGLDRDGLVLYGAGPSPEARGASGFWQGLVAVNLMRREGVGDGRLILGDVDMVELTVDAQGGDPSLRDKVGGDPVEVFPSVEAALETLLDRHA